MAWYGWWRRWRVPGIAAVLGLTLVAAAGPAAAAAAAVAPPAIRVRLSGPAWQFPAPVTGLGVAGPGRLWVFLSQRAVLPPDALWEVQLPTRRVLLRLPLPPGTVAAGASADGAAFVAEPTRLQEWWQGRHESFPLPTGTEALALAPVSHGAVWVALRLGVTGRVEVGLYRLPAEVLVYAHHVPGMANEGVSSLAAAPDGCWLASTPRPVLYFSPAVGGPSTYTHLYATAFFPSGARSLTTVAVNARGQGWLSGYAASGQPAVWRVAGVGQLGPAVPLPPAVNMVAAGLAVSAGGVGYVAFSAVGGSSGFPGVAGVSPAGETAAAVWPGLGNPGGGIGPLLLAPAGRLWAAMPFSRLLLPLTVSS